jgi:uncharacterized protein
VDLPYGEEPLFLIPVALKQPRSIRAAASSARKAKSCIMRAETRRADPGRRQVEESHSMKSSHLAAVIAAAMAGASASAQTPATAPAPATLDISADAEVQAAPDIAEIGAGVMTESAQAEQALRDNAERMSRVVAAIRKAGVADRDIQTTGLNLQPQFRYEQNREPILTGFRASNRVQVTLRDTKNAGRIIDTLVREGANQIDGPNFRISNPEPLLDKARQEAVRKARARADLYAAAAGLRVKRITSISEGQDIRPMPSPAPRVAMAMEAKADSPIVPGEVSMTVTIRMGFELE